MASWFKNAAFVFETIIEIATRVRVGRRGGRSAGNLSIERHTMQQSIRIGDSVYSLSSDDDYLAAMGDNFEPYMVELFRALIEPDDIVTDIGANIGLTAILFSSL